MKESEEKELLAQLMQDESGRNRQQYSYTVDVLQKNAILPLLIWPESNANVAKVIAGKVDYNKLPVDPENELYKGGLFPKQRDMIASYNGSEALCEALEMKPCIQKECPLYNPSLRPAICREFKIAFRR